MGATFGGGKGGPSQELIDLQRNQFAAAERDKSKVDQRDAAQRRARESRFRGRGLLKYAENDTAREVLG